jgi:Uma2 family endonuclease
MSQIAERVAQPITESDGDQCVVLRDIGWEGYRRILKIRGERNVPRMVYLDGSLLLMSPSLRHENLKERFGLFVAEVVVGLSIPCILAGSTTLRRQVKRGGVEGDQTYYFSNLSRIRGKEKINLRVDPPPDLAIEVVVSHGADEAMEVYRRFKVPELWICGQNELTILHLNASGRYVSAERSLVFPMLTAAEIHSWIIREQEDTDTDWIKALRFWVLEVLVPRHRELSKENPRS